MIGITPDPASKDHYVLRIVAPLTRSGGTPLSEVRNDARAVERAADRAKIDGAAGEAK